VADANLEIVIRAQNQASKAMADVQKALDDLAKSGVTTGQQFIKTGDDALGLDVRHRKLETTTRILGMEMSNMARSGFTQAAAATSASSAIGLLGNSLTFASGPLGLAFVAVTALAEGLLTWYTNANKANTATIDLTESTDALRSAADTLEANNEIGASRRLLRASKILESEKQLAAAGKLLKDLAGERMALEQQNEPILEQLARTKERLARDEKAANQLGGEFVTIAKMTRLEVSNLEAQLKPTAARITLLGEATFATGEALAIMNEAMKDIGKSSASGQMGIGAITVGIANMGIETDNAFLQMHKNMDLTKVKWHEVSAAAKDSAVIQILVARMIAEEQMRRDAAMFQYKISAFQQTAQVAGALATYLQQTGQASFETVQALRMGEAVINTAAGIMNAIGGSGIPYPYNLVAAASVAALGAIQIATIASASPGSSGSVSMPSGSTSSGGTNSPFSNSQSGTNSGSMTRTGQSFAGGGGNTMYVYFNGVVASDEAIELLFRRARQIGISDMSSNRQARVAGVTR